MFFPIVVFLLMDFLSHYVMNSLGGPWTYSFRTRTGPHTDKVQKMSIEKMNVDETFVWYSISFWYIQTSKESLHFGPQSSEICVLYPFPWSSISVSFSYPFSSDFPTSWLKWTYWRLPELVALSQFTFLNLVTLESFVKPFTLSLKLFL